MDAHGAHAAIESAGVHPWRDLRRFTAGSLMLAGPLLELAVRVFFDTPIFHPSKIIIAAVISIALSLAGIVLYAPRVRRGILAALLAIVGSVALGSFSLVTVIFRIRERMNLPFDPHDAGHLLSTVGPGLLFAAWLVARRSRPIAFLGLIPLILLIGFFEFDADVPDLPFEMAGYNFMPIQTNHWLTFVTHMGLHFLALLLSIAVAYTAEYLVRRRQRCSSKGAIGAHVRRDA